MKPSSGDCGKQPDHGGHDPVFLDEVYLPLENIGRIAVEADYEPSHDSQPVAMYRRDRFGEAAPEVLRLAAFFQTLFDGRLKAEETPC